MTKNTGDLVEAVSKADRVMNSSRLLELDQLAKNSRFRGLISFVSAASTVLRAFVLAYARGTGLFS